MKNSRILIDEIKDCIENSAQFRNRVNVVRAFEKVSLPVPLKKIYISLLCTENKVNYYLDSNNQKQFANYVTVRISCFTPPTGKIHNSIELLEKLFDELKLSQGDNIYSFETKDTKYDKDIRAYKTLCFLKLKFDLQE